MRNQVTFMKYLFITGMLFCCGSAFGKSDINSIAVNVANGEMLLSYQGHNAAIGVEVGTKQESNTNILFRANKNNRIYLVIDYERPSNPNNPAGMCGAGQEGTLIWVNAAEDMANLHQLVVLYDSCYKDINLDENHLGASTLYTSFIDYDNNKKTILRYDNNYPERGFQIEVKKLPLKSNKTAK
jgi:hypothetical protein